MPEREHGKSYGKKQKRRKRNLFEKMKGLLISRPDSPSPILGLQDHNPEVLNRHLIF